VPAETYLRRCPALAAEVEWGLELVYGEFLLPADQIEGYLNRLADGEPEVAEQVRGLYRSQDPQLSERLERRPGHQARALRQRLEDRRETGPWEEPAVAPSCATPYAFLAPPEAPSELGRLGGYRVLRVLGAGGMGVVFEAEEERPLRRVALKVMQPESPQNRTQSPWYSRRFWLMRPGVRPN
jgi:hypothetical protein